VWVGLKSKLLPHSVSLHSFFGSKCSRFLFFLSRFPLLSANFPRFISFSTLAFSCLSHWTVAFFMPFYFIFTFMLCQMFFLSFFYRSSCFFVMFFSARLAFSHPLHTLTHKSVSFLSQWRRRWCYMEQICRFEGSCTVEHNIIFFLMMIKLQNKNIR